MLLGWELLEGSSFRSRVIYAVTAKSPHLRYPVLEDLGIVERTSSQQQSNKVASVRKGGMDGLEAPGDELQEGEGNRRCDIERWDHRVEAICAEFGEGCRDVGMEVTKNDRACGGIASWHYSP
jgi:hypothetical protein